jgi:hypothetical protein
MVRRFDIQGKGIISTYEAEGEIIVGFETFAHADWGKSSEIRQG